MTARLQVVYRPDGCIDFAATKAVKEGTALTPEDLCDLEEYLGDLSSLDLDPNEQATAESYREFWSDSCWTEDPPLKPAS